MARLTAPAEVESGDWYPDYSADQAGLAVCFWRGRWFASWSRLEEAASTCPEDRRQALAGLGEAQASVLRAACVFAARLACRRVPNRRPLGSLEELTRFLTLRYQQRDQEVMGALFLNARHRLLFDREIFRGTLHRAAVEPRQILEECLLRGASGILLFHTHPSGDPTPSGADVEFTVRMAQAAELVGVELVDHLVLGFVGVWVSLRAEGVWQGSGSRLGWAAA